MNKYFFTNIFLHFQFYYKLHLNDITDCDSNDSNEISSTSLKSKNAKWLSFTSLSTIFHCLFSQNKRN